MRPATLFFINNVLKPERVVCSKCQHRSSIKMTSLNLATSGQFFFHANQRISSAKQQRNIFSEHAQIMRSHKEPSSLGFLRNNTLKFPRSIHRFSIWLFFFSTLSGKPLTRLTEASIIDEKKILIKYSNRCEGPDRLA